MTETSASSAPVPPVATRVPTTRTFHGDTFIDSYEWLRDKESPDTVAYLEAENAYTQVMNAHLGELREAVFTEIKSRTQETDLSVPSRTGDFWYYSRTFEGQQYPILCRLRVADPDDWTPPVLEPDRSADDEQILLDCNKQAVGHDFFALCAFAVSLDGSQLAYSTDVVGDERFTIRILDVGSGRLLPDEIPNTMHGAIWSASGSHLFYTTVDDAWRPEKVWRHQVGLPGVQEDVCVFHETDEKFWVSVDRTTSDRFIVIGSGSRVTSEARVLDAADPTAVPVVVITRQDGVEYDIEHVVTGGIDRWLVLHNREAQNFTLGIGDLGLRSLDDLETVVAPDPRVRLTDMHVSRDTVAVNLREDALAQVRVFPVGERGLGQGANITFDETMFSARATEFSDWQQPLVRLSYESWLTPRTVIDYDPRTGKRLVRKQQPVIGYDPSQFRQLREWVRSRDGVDVPVSIVHHKDVSVHDNAPCLLYGYGSYEISVDPSMRIPVVSLLERGMVFAVAHVRGGGEMGRGWYEHGKLLEKKNTFNDFVDSARHLVDTGWTSTDRLVAHGGSAGGLLMGAVANQAPDLFAGVVCHVPFVDALTSILKPDLPLTVIEWDEWGDPLHDPEVYAYMKSYTPYENVSATEYPAIYSLTSINDTRVLYVEPAKWTAQLRATTTGSRPILFKCEMSAGHGGASGRYDFWRETADYLAWVIDVAGARTTVS
ncbi:MAG: oligopeptidase [Nocardioidaceae bacterium]|nr:oligopeptidase [Nocardioidaceae bacterium]